MDENPYQSPESPPDQRQVERRDRFWPLMLFGPSQPWAFLVPIAVALAAIAFALVVQWLTEP